MRSQGLAKVRVHPQCVDLTRVDDADDELLVKGEKPNGENGDGSQTSRQKFITDAAHDSVWLCLSDGFGTFGCRIL